MLIPTTLAKIVAIDPGVSTGVAIKVDNTYLTLTLSLHDISQGELLDLVQDAQQVIIEYFAAFASHGLRISGYGIRTVEIVGKVMAYCETNKIALARQAPQNRKAFVTKAQRLVTPGSTRHEVDALAHLLAWEYRNKPLPVK